jgi:hypothetical protein
MKTIAMSLLLIMLIPAFTFAGEIYGSIKEGEKSIGEGVKVKVTMKTAPETVKADSTKTDKYGSYRLFVKEKGKCNLEVNYKNETPSIEIYSYDNSQRYDLVLEKGKDGKYLLRRK